MEFENPLRGSNVLRRLFESEERPVETITTVVAEGVTCTFSRVDTSSNDAHVKITINHSLSQRLTVDVEVHVHDSEPEVRQSAENATVANS